jgi:beta-glucanase (GH16 family)
MDTKYTFQQRYGYFESRIRFDKGDGFWPAFWVSQTPEVTHPEELDVMEVCANSIGRYSYANDARDLHTTIHFPDGSQQFHDYTSAGDLSLGWHTYAMDWRSDHISFFLDGVQVWRYAGANISSQSLPVVLNYAMGGSWCGGATSTTPSSGIMQVDYVRVKA